MLPFTRGEIVEKTLMCCCCPNNPEAIEKTLKLIAVKTEDLGLSNCEVCCLLVKNHVFEKSQGDNPFAHAFVSAKNPAAPPCEVAHS